MLTTHIRLAAADSTNKMNKKKEKKTANLVDSELAIANSFRGLQKSLGSSQDEIGSLFFLWLKAICERVASVVCPLLAPQLRPVPLSLWLEEDTQKRNE